MITDLLVGRQPANQRYYVVAVDGRGGSGKSTFVSHLAASDPTLVTIAGDDYFEPLDGELAWGDFNEERCAAELLQPLSEGRSPLHRRPYVWDVHEVVQGDSETIARGGTVVFERCFSFALPVDWDLKIWVDAPCDECLRRGVDRDAPHDDHVRRIWAEVWQPREDAYIERLRPQEHADVVLDGTLPWSPQLSLS